METTITVWILLTLWSTPISEDSRTITSATNVYETEEKCEEEKRVFLSKQAKLKHPKWATPEDYKHGASCNWVQITPSAFAKPK